MIDYKLIGERLKKARKNKSLTQEDISKKLNVSLAFLSRIERGSSFINLKRLSQLCELLGVTEGFILNGTNMNTAKYLNNEFEQLLDRATDKQKRLIYEIAKTIIND